MWYVYCRIHADDAKVWIKNPQKAYFTIRCRKKNIVIAICTIRH